MIHVLDPCRCVYTDISVRVMCTGAFVENIN